MLKVMKIESVGEYGQFTLVDENGEKHVLLFEFYQTPPLEKGDKIMIDEVLLDRQYEGFVQPYAFEKTTKGEILKNKAPLEEIGYIEKQGEKIVIRRIFG